MFAASYSVHIINIQNSVLNWYEKVHKAGGNRLNDVKGQFTKGEIQMVKRPMLCSISNN